MSEHSTAANFLGYAAQAGIELLRANAGKFRSLYGNQIIEGFPQGFPDYVGYRSVVVTEDMVGQTVAIFAAAEIKAKTDTRTEQQRKWADKLREAGALYACVTPATIQTTIAEWTSRPQRMTAPELHALMEQHGLTVDGLAEQMGVSSRAVQFWRSGTFTVPAKAAHYLRGL